MFTAAAPGSFSDSSAPGEVSTAERDEQEAELAVYPPLRVDLVIHRAHFRRRASYVVKDPVALKYYRLGEREYQAARLLDGHRRGFEIVEEMRRLRPGEDFRIGDLAAIVQMTMRMGLLSLDPGAARQLHHTLRELTRHIKRKTRLKRILGAVLFIKIPIFDPDLLLMRLDRKLGFLWTRGALAVQLCLLAAALVAVVSHSAMFVESVPDIFTWQNLVIMWICLILIKVVHEFGHGLACKHYGGEVHEMGAMFILGSPFLYCNASDSWIFPHKWQRLVVNFAGIYVEMFLAAIAAFVWVLTPQGIVHQVAMSVMIISSVTTVLFNANPLMKFDGYYALADWLEVPNLKERSDRDLIGRLAALFVGPAGRVRDAVAEAFPLIAVYGVASYLWAIVIFYNILRGVAYLLEPYGLHRLAGAAAAFVLGAGMFLPLGMAAKRVREVLRQQGDDDFLRRRALRTAGIIAAALLVIFLVPVPRHVTAAVVLDGSNRIPVERTLPRGASRVGRGETVATLRSNDLEARLAEAETDQATRQAVVDELSIDSQTAQLGPALAALRSAEAVLQEVREDAAQSVLCAPFDAVVLTADLPDRRGMFLRRGDTICELLPVGRIGAAVALDERSASLVQAGQTAYFRLSAAPSRRFQGVVEKTLRQNAASLPHESLSVSAGGTVAMSAGAVQPGASRSAPPLHPVYRAEIVFDNPEGFLRPGMSGRARIDTGWTNIAVIVWEYISRIVRTEFRF
jgi:putative peptide zinc metalloprotease protein